MPSCASSPATTQVATGPSSSSQTVGFYMAPECGTAFQICVDGNGFADTMSVDAAGITACLFALSHLSFQIRNASIANHYHQLRDFALEHAEAGKILAAID